MLTRVIRPTVVDISFPKYFVPCMSAMQSKPKSYGKGQDQSLDPHAKAWTFEAKAFMHVPRVELEIRIVRVTAGRDR